MNSQDSFLPSRFREAVEQWQTEECLPVLLQNHSAQHCVVYLLTKSYFLAKVDFFFFFFLATA